MTYTTSIRTHHVRRQPTAMIRTTRTRAIPHAANLPNPPRERGNNLLGALDRTLLTRPQGRNLGCFVTAEPGGLAVAALHLAGPGAERVRAGRAGTVRCPAAVGVGAEITFGLDAAFDVGWVGGTGAADGGAA